MRRTPPGKDRPPSPAKSWALLAAAAVAAFLAISISYGFNTEYGDTGAGPTSTALRTFTGSSVAGVLIVGLLAAGAILVGRRGRLIRALAALVFASTVVGLPLGAVLGVQAKYHRYPQVPDCVGEFHGGPALPVVRAAQAAFEEIEHPARFSGGGSSGIDGCSSQLMVSDRADPRPSYRSQLPELGWAVVADDRRGIVATRGGQRFELTQDGDGWWVWIGPSEVRERQLEEGQVGPADGAAHTGSLSQGTAGPPPAG